MRGLAKGILAGIAGTAVVQLLSGRREPVYAPGQIVARLAGRYLRCRLSSWQRHRTGTILRWLYGLSWGGAFGAVQELAQIPYPLTAVGLGATIWFFEVGALPMTGATPPLRRWGRRQIVGDGMQAMLFGVATASALVLLEEG